MRRAPKRRVHITLLLTLSAVVAILFLSFHYSVPDHQDIHPKIEYRYTMNKFIPIGEKPLEIKPRKSLHEIKEILHRKNYNTDVHAFYYYWYKNKKTDGKYEHWNHKVLPHWQENVNKNYPQIGTELDPEKDQIGADFWPQRGLYSNGDRDTVKEQFLELRDKANVSVVVVSWWGRGGGDQQSSGVDHVTPIIFDVAKEVGMKVVMHLEPYVGRNAKTVKQDLQHMIEKYGKNEALYRHPKTNLPMCYLYDSYHTPAEEWSSILSSSGADTIRGTDHDHVMISLYLSAQESQDFIIKSNFDGFYTYFAAQKFTYGSTTSNWETISNWANNNKLIFIPSVGPGYMDTKIRPWNDANTQDRRKGGYYDDMWSEAIRLKVPLISITSYNEWHEGTQIEPAVPKQGYKDYGELEPDFYLVRTSHWVNKYTLIK
ncbi:endo-alpha-1 [Acrasis kona]|uniref:Endo-alpha-1 n=1 Tax=Acrasis kona TaxID=1008807 RepID=A0AAW2ZRC7_9EUKA